MSPFPIFTQVSAGGVAYREQNQSLEVALILVGPNGRWQLPKGAINEGEEIENAAQREVHEEAGIKTALLGLIDRIEYWFYATREGKRIRLHKYVYFYLMQYLSGSPEDHDNEVIEARWVEINQAVDMLSFDSEREVVRKAIARIQPKSETSLSDSA